MQSHNRMVNIVATAIIDKPAGGICSMAAPVKAALVDSMQQPVTVCGGSFIRGSSFGFKA